MTWLKPLAPQAGITDCHVHIGQWYDRYYSAEEVFDSVAAQGDVTRLVFSSTTSEMHLPPAELYSNLTREVQDAVALAKREYKGLEALPLFWYVPEYLDAGITAEKAVADERFSYKDFDPKTIRKDFTPATQRAKESTQEVLEKHFNGKPHLTSFQIELTSRCNERCVHCYIQHENKLYDIKDELYYKVLDQLTAMGVLSVTLSGGEPMLHPHFLDFLLAAQKKDFSVNVLSNLTLLKDDIVKAMKETRLSSVQVSLYSMIPDPHDAITTVKGSFEKTRDAILKLVENDIPLQISCPAMKANKADYKDVLKWAHEHKVRAVTDYIMMARFSACVATLGGCYCTQYDHTTSNLDNRLSLDEVDKVIKDIMAGDEDYQAEIMKSDFMERCNSLCFDPERFFNSMGYGSALIELCVYSYCIATTPARKKAAWGLVLLAWWQMATCTLARVGRSASAATWRKRHCRRYGTIARSLSGFAHSV